MKVGFPRMHKEAGERRDYLPGLVGTIARAGVEVAVETGIGSGMGLSDDDYTSRSPVIRAVSNEEAFAQDVVVTLRAPETEEFDKLQRLNAAYNGKFGWPFILAVRGPRGEDDTVELVDRRDDDIGLEGAVHARSDESVREVPTAGEGGDREHDQHGNARAEVGPLGRHGRRTVRTIFDCCCWLRRIK